MEETIIIASITFVIGYLLGIAVGYGFVDATEEDD